MKFEEWNLYTSYAVNNHICVNDSSYALCYVCTIVHTLNTATSSSNSVGLLLKSVAVFWST